MTARERIEFLSRSASRPALLEALYDEPGRRAALARQCEVSRSTAHRAIEAFEEFGWVEIEGGVCRLTAGGQCVLAGYRSLAETIDRLDEYESFLQRFDGEIPAEALADATVVASTPQNPHRALYRFGEAVSAAGFDRFRGIAPITSPLFDSLRESLLDAGVSIEVVIDRSVHETLRDADATVLREARSTPAMSLWVHPEPIPFGLALLDGRVLVGAYDDRGNLCECLDGRNRRLRQWANAVYRDHRERARPLDALMAE